jgi:hypothetical protein
MRCEIDGGRAYMRKGDHGSSISTPEEKGKRGRPEPPVGTIVGRTTREGNRGMTDLDGTRLAPLKRRRYGRDKLARRPLLDRTRRRGRHLLRSGRFGRRLELRDPLVAHGTPRLELVFWVEHVGCWVVGAKKTVVLLLLLLIETRRKCSENEKRGTWVGVERKVWPESPDE